MSLIIVKTDKDIVTAVKARLPRWRDYDENRTLSTPSSAHNHVERFADELYNSGKLVAREKICATNPAFDVSDAIIVEYCKRKDLGKYAATVALGYSTVQDACALEKGLHTYMIVPGAELSEREDIRKKYAIKKQES